MTKNLALTGYERGYLTAYYDAVILQDMANCCDEDWYGIQIGNRMFDMNAWVDEDTGEFVCTAYECEWINDNWQTNCEYSWILTEKNDGSKIYD
tara:strand:+ start:1331 stop:1612 length:282 start_codon:yes stop_codon:yes gene_type:complete